MTFDLRVSDMINVGETFALLHQNSRGVKFGEFLEVVLAQILQEEEEEEEECRQVECLSPLSSTFPFLSPHFLLNSVINPEAQRFTLLLI